MAKGCGHDNTLMEDECSCYVPHTNTADAGLPHTSLTDRIADLEERMSQIARISGELVNAQIADETTKTRVILIRALAV